MIKSNPKKKKVESLSTITNRLDKLVSKIVRLRDQYCVTCGSTQDAQCGHFIPRDMYPTRWDLTNCHRQCSSCNLYQKGNMVVYHAFIRREYGEKYPETLDALSRGPAPKRFERLALEVELKEELRKLEALNE